MTDAPNAIDNFDPLPHGYEPVRLEELVDVADSLVSSVERFQVMLHGCTTPLNLRGVNKIVGECYLALLGILTEMGTSTDIINHDLPISGQFGKPVRNWDTADLVPRVIEPGELLSPKQVVTLHQIQDDHPEYPRTTYREILASGSRVPPLIMDAQARAAKQVLDARKAELLAAVEDASWEILADVESRPCPTCGVVSSAFCRTSSGRIAEKPHRPRVKLSTIAEANPQAAAVMSRQIEAYEELTGRPWPTK